MQTSGLSFSKLNTSNNSQVNTSNGNIKGTPKNKKNSIPKVDSAKSLKSPASRNKSSASLSKVPSDRKM
jgi:hypothetical protein